MANIDVGEALRTFLNEPRVDDPPRRVWRDWVLVATATIGVLIEALFRNDIVWPWISAAVVIFMALQLLWRRTNPLLAFVLAFGSVLVFDTVRLLADHPPSNIYSAVFVLILMYSVYRWGSGRDAAIATVLALVVAIVVNAMEFTGLGDLIGGFIVLEFPAVVGLAVRFRGVARRTAVEQAKIHEREMLARELHDTVAHHVSAIVIQAQAGRFLAKSDSLDGAANALEVIEEEASRTLAEMRSIVGVLRSPHSAEALAPQHGIDDIDALAAATALSAPTITVRRNGDLASVKPAVGAALYRLAQEAITNAVRHARNSTQVEVLLDGRDDAVSLSITNDGDMVGSATSSQGFGLIGMAERATLLGGTLEAGPLPQGGWSVQALLPRDTPIASS